MVLTRGGRMPRGYEGDAAVVLATTAPSARTISMPYLPRAAAGVIKTNSAFDGVSVGLGRAGEAVVRVPEGANVPQLDTAARRRVTSAAVRIICWWNPIARS